MREVWSRPSGFFELHMAVICTLLSGFAWPAKQTVDHWADITDSPMCPSWLCAAHVSVTHSLWRHPGGCQVWLLILLLLTSGRSETTCWVHTATYCMRVRLIVSYAQQCNSFKILSNQKYMFYMFCHITNFTRIFPIKPFFSFLP